MDPGHGVVEGRCAGLARARGPLRRVLAALAGRFHALRGWERIGYARAGDYTRERLGLSARELSDLARVDTALRLLPHLEKALIAGELPWTKARLIARNAKPETEVAWIAFARRVSVRQLERHVCAVDTDSIEGGGAEPEPEDETRREGVVMQLRPDTQAKWQFGWRLARRVAGEALDPGSCAEWILAEVLSALPAMPDGEVEAAPGLGFQERRTARWRQRNAPTRALRMLFEEATADAGKAAHGQRAEPVRLPAFLAELADDLEAVDAFTLDARLRRAVALEQASRPISAPCCVGWQVSTSTSCAAAPVSSGTRPTASESARGRPGRCCGSNARRSAVPRYGGPTARDPSPGSRPRPSSRS